MRQAVRRVGGWAVRGASITVLLTAYPPTRLTGQQPDTTRRDTTVQQLKPIEVTGSIVPTAGPTIGSGVPARISVVTGEQLENWEPRPWVKPWIPR